MKVRAYLAEEEDILTCSEDSAHHIDFTTSTDDPERVQWIVELLFDDHVRYLDRFCDSHELERYCSEHKVIHHKLFWTGAGMYLLWRRMIYRSDILLQREIEFMIALEENLDYNDAGDLDYLFKEC